MSDKMFRADDGPRSKRIGATSSRRMFTGFGLLIASTLLFTACESDNALGGGGGGTAPEITNLAGPSSIGAGDTLNLTVSAEGQRLIQEIRIVWQAGGGASRDTTVAVESPAQVISQLVRIPMPETLSGTSVNVSIRVADQAGATSDLATLSIPIEDAEDPGVTILQPGPPAVEGDTAAVAGGTSLRIAAHVTDASGIARVHFVGYAFRGDAELGTDERVVRFEERVVEFPAQGVDTLPTDTIIRRDLVQLGDSTETVFVIVTATDLFGNVSADTVPIKVGGPNVALVRPTEEQIHRQTADLTVRVAVSDSMAGIQTVALHLSGIIRDTIQLDVPGQPLNDTIDYVLPSGVFTSTGTLFIQARASNSRGIFATTTAVSVIVIDATEPDVTAPRVELEVNPLPGRTAPLSRLEQEDTVYVTVRADDEGGEGIQQLGVVVNAILNSGADTVQFTRSTMLSAARTNPDTTFAIAVREIYELAAPGQNLAQSVSWPDSIDILFDAFAMDVAGNTAWSQVPVGATASRGYLLAVAGFTVRLQSGGIISDAVIDTVANNERLFLSNFTQSRVDVLALRDTSFLDGGILAGAQPWGLFIDNSGDTLLVANSGGTNLSKVPLRDPNLAEAQGARIFTPEVSIYDIEVTLDEQLNETYTGVVIGFSDRPQFLAQAVNGDILYSTVPTPSAQDGTIRRIERQAGWNAYDTDLLYPGGDPADEEQDSRVLIIDADSVVIVPYGAGDSVRVFDHVRGFPNSVVVGEGTPFEAVAEVQAQGGDAVIFAGGYDPSGVGLQDTTFVAASGNREWIAFGEGAAAPVGRIIMWDAVNRRQSNTVQIIDLIDNASERVTGVGLNQNGSLGVARGEEAAYYFTNDLRLQGVYAEDINPGGYGAALHPLHDTYQASGPFTLSFVGTAESTIKVIDTFHFFALGELPIKERVVGPLKATLPLQDFDNVGLACPGDPRCVVAKLFGVTQSAGAQQPDGVVIISVREKDLE